MDNQYFLGHLPSTDLAVVKVHIALTFLGYILLREFQQLVADWLHNAEYATIELRRFARQFLRAPIAWLQWLKARQPGQRRPQLRPRYRDFCASLAHFGDPETRPNYFRDVWLTERITPDLHPLPARRPGLSHQACQLSAVHDGGSLQCGGAGQKDQCAGRSARWPYAEKEGRGQAFSAAVAQLKTFATGRIAAVEAFLDQQD